MNRWWMLGGIFVWLALAAFGLKWIFEPYFWVNAGSFCGCQTKTVEDARQEFFIHVAPFPDSTNATPVAPANDDEPAEIADALTLNWSWRETLGRFGVGFGLWMSSGWFIHWFMGRLAHGNSAKIR